MPELFRTRKKFGIKHDLLHSDAYLHMKDKKTRRIKPESSSYELHSKHCWFKHKKAIFTRKEQSVVQKFYPIIIIKSSELKIMKE